MDGAKVLICRDCGREFKFSQAEQLTLRLQVAQVSLEKAKLAAENEGLRALQETVATLESRVSELEQQRSRKRSKLRHWLRLSH